MNKRGNLLILVGIVGLVAVIGLVVLILGGNRTQYMQRMEPKNYEAIPNGEVDMAGQAVASILIKGCYSSDLYVGQERTFQRQGNYPIILKVADIKGDNTLGSIHAVKLDIKGYTPKGRKVSVSRWLGVEESWIIQGLEIEVKWIDVNTREASISICPN